MAWTNRTVVMGFYQGIGDFLSAVPVANELLRNGNHVTIVASKPNLQLAELISFHEPGPQMLEFATFSRAPRRSLQLLPELRRLRPDYIVVSPHAQKKVSSWKLPLLLWTLKRLSSRRPLVIGAEDERLSHLYDRRLPVDKALDLIAREWSLYSLAGAIDRETAPDLHVFRKPVPTTAVGRYDLVVHPGASRDVKMWPLGYHRELVQRLDDRLRIAYVGLPHELAPLEGIMSGMRNVEFITGRIGEAISVVAAASVVLTMDSGFSHVASLLGVPHLALFGSTDPIIHKPPSPRSQLLYRKALPCQPCNQHTCRLGHVACMRIIKPYEVAAVVQAALPDHGATPMRRRKTRGRPQPAYA